MKKFPVVMDSLHFEIRYAYGNLYFDRCGQCLNDIERNCEGWRVTTADPSGAILEHPDNSFSIQFNNERFVFSSQKSSRLEIKAIAREANTAWKIIEANLGLEEYLRQGCRIFYIVGTESLEYAEKLLEKAELNVQIPKKITEAEFKRKNLNITTVLTRENYEYRVQVMTITRYEAMNPDNLIRSDPRFLSSKQEQIRKAKLKQLAEYSSNPMYAISLDVDCYQAQPEKISIEDFIIEQSDIVKTYFLPIMEKL
jgi:hypothetical protein